MSLSKNEIKFLKSLQQKKYRDEEQLFVVEGTKLVTELLRSGKFKIKNLYVTDDCPVEIASSPLAQRITGAELGRISGLKSPNQALAVVHMAETTEITSSTDQLVLFLEDLKDPGNLGTIIRTADWFGIKQVICSPKTVDCYNPKVVQATMGSIFRLEIIYTDLNQACDDLIKSGFHFYGADMNGSDAFETSFEAKSVLVMGSESHGLSTALADKLHKITIPKIGAAESLNVSIAAGILMAQYAQHKK